MQTAPLPRRCATPPPISNAASSFFEKDEGPAEDEMYRLEPSYAVWWEMQAEKPARLLPPIVNEDNALAVHRARQGAEGDEDPCLEAPSPRSSAVSSVGCDSAMLYVPPAPATPPDEPLWRDVWECPCGTITHISFSSCQSCGCPFPYQKLTSSASFSSASSVGGGSSAMGSHRGAAYHEYHEASLERSSSSINYKLPVQPMYGVLGGSVRDDMPPPMRSSSCGYSDNGSSIGSGPGGGGAGCPHPDDEAALPPQGPAPVAKCQMTVVGDDRQDIRGARWQQQQQQQPPPPPAQQRSGYGYRTGFAFHRNSGFRAANYGMVGNASWRS